MKRAEGIKWYKAHREQVWRRMVKAGEMRLSEFVMSIGPSLDKEAASWWRKHRAQLSACKLEDWVKNFERSDT